MQLDRYAGLIDGEMCLNDDRCTVRDDWW